MSIVKNIAKVLLILIAITMCIIAFSPSKPVRCCYICERPINDTDTWCKTCAYPLDSIVIRNMTWFEKSTYGWYHSKPGQW